MLMYLAAFAVSIGLAACGEGLYQKKNQKGGVACLVLAVLVAALLAGLRDVSVGTDSVVYEEWFRYAWNMDGWGDYLFKAYAKTEPFFMSLIYLASRLGSAVQGAYFLIGLCTYGFAMAAIALLRKKVSIPLAWASYLFLFFGHSLNEMRQALAMTALLLAVSLLMRKNYIGYVVFTVLALLSHSTSILLSAAILGIYLILKKWDIWQVKTALLGCTAAAVLLYEPLFYALSRIGALPERFSSYVEEISGVHLSLNPILVRLPFLLLAVVFYREFARKSENKTDKSDADFLLVMMGMEMILSELRIFSVTLYRICLYFGVFRCLGIGRLVAALRESPKFRKWEKPIIVLLLAMLAVIWVYQAVLQGNDEIYPYTSELLHISEGMLF